MAIIEKRRDHYVVTEQGIERVLIPLDRIPDLFNALENYREQFIDPLYMTKAELAALEDPVDSELYPSIIDRDVVILDENLDDIIGIFEDLEDRLDG